MPSGQGFVGGGGNPHQRVNNPRRGSGGNSGNNPLGGGGGTGHGNGLDGNNQNPPVAEEHIEQEVSYDTIRITCKSESTKLCSDKIYVGIYVTNIGSYDSKNLTGNTIYPGWILMKNVEEVDKEVSEEGVFG